MRQDGTTRNSRHCFIVQEQRPNPIGSEQSLAVNSSLAGPAPTALPLMICSACGARERAERPWQGQESRRQASPCPLPRIFHCACACGRSEAASAGFGTARARARAPLRRADPEKLEAYGGRPVAARTWPIRRDPIRARASIISLPTHTHNHTGRSVEHSERGVSQCPCVWACGGSEQSHHPAVTGIVVLYY
uniref:Uncharacterized protein n=1 Tax=Setaria viridis TaxID=4556 RepID=A0A4U6U5M1_SETVI|nr:hypothetical protein SEVIR_6G195501v2 [Setaria viridis]